jgi:hypothetical protein
LRVTGVRCQDFGGVNLESHLGLVLYNFVPRIDEECVEVDNCDATLATLLLQRLNLRQDLRTMRLDIFDIPFLDNPAFR